MSLVPLPALGGRAIDAIVIGASAGGVEALSEILPALRRGAQVALAQQPEAVEQQQHEGTHPPDLRLRHAESDRHHDDVEPQDNSECDP